MYVIYNYFSSWGPTQDQRFLVLPFLWGHFVSMKPWRMVHTHTHTHTHANSCFLHTGCSFYRVLTARIAACALHFPKGKNTARTWDCLYQL